MEGKVKLADIIKIIDGKPNWGKNQLKEQIFKKLFGDLTVEQ